MIRPGVIQHIQRATITWIVTLWQVTYPDLLEARGHFAIQEPMLEAMKMAVDMHPTLFRHLRLRDYPAWWPFTPK